MYWVRYRTIYRQNNSSQIIQSQGFSRHLVEDHHQSLNLNEGGCAIVFLSNWPFGSVLLQIPHHLFSISTVLLKLTCRTSRRIHNGKTLDRVASVGWFTWCWCWQIVEFRIWIHGCFSTRIQVAIFFEGLLPRP